MKCIKRSEFLSDFRISAPTCSRMRRAPASELQMRPLRLDCMKLMFTTEKPHWACIATRKVTVPLTLLDVDRGKQRSIGGPKIGEFNFFGIANMGNLSAIRAEHCAWGRPHKKKGKKNNFDEKKSFSPVSLTLLMTPTPAARWTCIRVRNWVTESANALKLARVTVRSTVSSFSSLCKSNRRECATFFFSGRFFFSLSVEKSKTRISLLLI
jgi:hypothetical protein